MSMRGSQAKSPASGETFVVSQATIQSFRPRFERILAFLLLGLSGLLSITAFSSGPPVAASASVFQHLAANVTPLGAVVGALFQVGITAFEWTYAADRNKKYWGALVLDVLLTYAGAWKVVAPPFRQWMSTMFDADPFGFGTAFFAGLVILIGAYGLAYLPEATLVEGR